MTALYIALGILALLVIIDLAVAVGLIRIALIRNRAQDDEPQPDDTPSWKAYFDAAIAGKAWINEKGPERVDIRSFDGLRLRGWLLMADAPSKNTVICVHGYRANGRFDFGAIAPFIHSLGCNALFVDDRAHGESEGKYIGFADLDSLDCADWCRYIANRFGEDSRIVLYGLSMGAATVLTASGDPKLPAQVKGVVGDCGFTSMHDELKLQIKEMFHIPPFPVLNTVELILKLFHGYDPKGRRASERVKHAPMPILIIHGAEDKFVPTSMGRLMYENAPGDKRLLIVEGAVHAHSYLIGREAYEQAFRELYEKVCR